MKCYTMSIKDESAIPSGDPDQPGSLALAVVNETKDVFKKPFPVTGSKRKVEILDEETYLEEIGKIIQRDFFPDLEKLKAQNAYLEAVESNNLTKLREIYSKYSIGKRPLTDACQSPATFETPVMRKIESSDSLKTSKSDTNETIDVSKSPEKEKRLDEFLKTHTSEDNESFEEIVKENEVRQRAKHPWLYKNDNLALSASAEPLAIEDRPANVDTWAYRNKNYIMYVPDGAELSRDAKLEMIKNKKEINHKATRLVECPFNEEQNKEAIQSLALFQARVLDGKIGVDGKELSRMDTPNVNGYDFLKTPSPMPGVDESPLMTWGQIEGTPFRLDGSDTPIRPGLPGPVFKIAEPPMREKLAHALAEKAGEKNRDQKQKALEVAKKQLTMASPKVGSSPFERFDAITPTTPRLSNSHLKNRINSDLLSSPRTPGKKLKPSIPLRLPDSSTCASTSSSSSSSSKQLLADNLSSMITAKRPDQNLTDDLLNINLNKRPKESLTDNLLNLNLPNRPKAADFFS